MRGGYVVPTQDPALTTTHSRNNDFGLIVALHPTQPSVGRVFLDDGESFLDDGTSSVVEFHCEGGKHKSSIIEKLCKSTFGYII